MTWHAALFSAQPEKFHKVYQPHHLTEISARCNLYPTLITPDNIDHHLSELARLNLSFQPGECLHLMSRNSIIYLI